MVYRYESDEDAFAGVPGARVRPVRRSAPVRPRRPGPSPSRFPTPVAAARTKPADAAARRAEPAASAPPSARSPRTRRGSHLGRSRCEAPARAGRLRRRPALAGAVGGAAVLVLLAALRPRRRRPAGRPRHRSRRPRRPTSPAPRRPRRPTRQDLDSRDTDQAPLTAKEVFPGTQLVVGDGQPAYQVLKTQSSGSCAVAATGEVADLLVRLGCNQVVRATLRAPDGDYLVTAGLFNLTDQASAERARDRIRQMLDERQGRFRGLAAGDDTEAMATAAGPGRLAGTRPLPGVRAGRPGRRRRRSQAGDAAVRGDPLRHDRAAPQPGVLERRADGRQRPASPTAGPSDVRRQPGRHRPDDELPATLTRPAPLTGASPTGGAAVAIGRAVSGRCSALDRARRSRRVSSARRAYSAGSSG